MYVFDSEGRTKYFTVGSPKHNNTHQKNNWYQREAKRTPTILGTIRAEPPEELIDLGSMGGFCPLFKAVSLAEQSGRRATRQQELTRIFH